MNTQTPPLFVIEEELESKLITTNEKNNEEPTNLYEKEGDEKFFIKGYN
ncbi:MAG: hypothetical protein HRT52_04755 [Colwellia sp.]|nr:hypothetical protein [Colwellia sp.]